MPKEKPWLSSREQVAQLKQKGVSFQLMNKADAQSYLSENNTYFRIRSYRTNFAKHASGAKEGLYINLDFGMLVDLAIIDMRLRDEMLKLTLDIEHFSKVELLREIESHGEDGYSIVSDFAEQHGGGKHALEVDFNQGLSSAYIGSLIQARPKRDFPVWEFIEVIPFGRFVRFYKFCAERFDDSRLLNRHFMLLAVKDLRNGCAHNSCILNDMKAGSNARKASWEVTKALGHIGIRKEARVTKMSNERLRQITTTLYLHQSICSGGMVSLRGEGLRLFVKRLKKNAGYYDESCPAHSALGFMERIIRAWYEPKSNRWQL